MAEPRLSPDETQLLQDAQAAVLAANQRASAEHERDELIRSLRKRPPGERVGVTEIANAVGLSRSHVNRIVKESTDVENGQ